jgi:large subunit ribosomal protein L22
MSPQKVRLVIDQMRGKDAMEALSLLKFMPQRAAKPVYKVIASAMANAEENFGMSREDLYIAEIFADGGPTRRWRRFGARGRFKPILKRSSHITVVLREYEE